MPKISELTAKATPVGADIFPILDSAASNANKRTTIDAAVQAVLGWRVIRSTGTTADTALIQAAIDSLPATGGVVYLPDPLYRLNATVAIGNGSSAAISTLQGVTILGNGIGQTANETAGEHGSTTLAWYGAAGPVMMHVNGPIAGCRFEGLYFQCQGGANMAGGALDMMHIAHSTFRNLQATNFSGSGFKISAYDSPTGTNNGANDNVWENVCVGGSNGTNAIGLEIGATSYGAAPHLDVALNTFINCNLRVGVSGSQVALKLNFTDALTFIGCTTSGTTGVLSAVPTGTSMFPDGIAFIDCFLDGAVTSVGTWSTTATPIVLMPMIAGEGRGLPSGAGYSGMDGRGNTFGMGHTFSPDNTWDIGANGTTRPRDLYLGRNAAVGGDLAVAGAAAITGTIQAPQFNQAGDGIGVVFQRSTSGYGKQFYVSVDTARGWVFDKGAGDVSANANTLFKFQTLGGIDSINPFWSGLQFYGHSITEGGGARFPVLAFFARSASATDPTDYEFLFSVDGTTALPLGLSFASKNVANSFVRFGFGNSGLSATALRLEYTGSAVKIGAFGAPPIVKPTVTGSRGANAALASLLTALANLGWLTDSSS